MATREVVLVEGVHNTFGKMDGALRDVPAEELEIAKELGCEPTRCFFPGNPFMKE